jgi:xanthine dehydrogenase iron-sulfur cluster and FAD-binding subunit A
MACGASVVLMSESNGKRTVKLDENFFIGYRKTIIVDTEIIYGLWIPLTAKVFICQNSISYELFLKSY